MHRFKFKELPPQIQEVMMDRQEEQGNSRNPEIFINDITISQGGGGFNWNDSEEGSSFWDDVTRGDFDQFYDCHPEKTIPIKPEYLGLYKKTFKINKVRYDHQIDLDAVKEKGLEHILL